MIQQLFDYLNQFYPVTLNSDKTEIAVLDRYVITYSDGEYQVRRNIPMTIETYDARLLDDTVHRLLYDVSNINPVEIV